MSSELPPSIGGIESVAFEEAPLLVRAVEAFDRSHEQLCHNGYEFARLPSERSRVNLDLSRRTVTRDLLNVVDMIDIVESDSDVSFPMTAQLLSGQDAYRAHWFAELTRTKPETYTSLGSADEVQDTMLSMYLQSSEYRSMRDIAIDCMVRSMDSSIEKFETNAVEQYNAAHKHRREEALARGIAVTAIGVGIVTSLWAALRKRPNA